MSATQREGYVHFWENWTDRFEKEHRNFITPGDPVVITELNKVKTPKWGQTIVDKIWDRVHENIDYKLSKEWKTPRETIQEGEGDCEDITFLIASMAEIKGISENFIEIGYLVFPDDTFELHTWNILDGRLVDGTGSKKSVKNLRYETIKRYVV